ncbi:MAG: glycoside hydrolase family 5 protein [Dysgonamonadaceae bacterium]|jgi:endoglucanase|nr:glycoside hydrolase family 5 protein [Dysgonamonadaceae bacterium]
MKLEKINIALLACLFLLFACERTNNNPAQPADQLPVDTSFVGRHGQLAVKGAALTDQNGDTIVLRGVSLGWHQWWSRFYSKETVEWLKKDWKPNLIRAAIGVEPDSGYLRKPEWAMQCLTTVVDAAIENDMYVIVDWHAHYIHLEEAQTFFTQVATKYKDTPNVLYEIFNEPWDDMPWPDVKAYSVEIIKTIRSIDKDNIILVGNPHWDQDVHIVADDPIIGYDNILYTLHFYAATHKQDLRDKAAYARSKGLPIFVSECAGMEASGDGAIDQTEWNRWLQWMEEHRLSWAAWSVSDKNETCSMIKSPASPASQWTNNDLKAWGIQIKQILTSEQ